MKKIVNAVLVVLFISVFMAPANVFAHGGTQRDTRPFVTKPPVANQATLEEYKEELHKVKTALAPLDIKTVPDSIIEHLKGLVGQYKFDEELQKDLQELYTNPHQALALLVCEARFEKPFEKEKIDRELLVQDIVKALLADEKFDDRPDADKVYLFFREVINRSQDSFLLLEDRTIYAEEMKRESAVEAGILEKYPTICRIEIHNTLASKDAYGLFTDIIKSFNVPIMGVNAYIIDLRGNFGGNMEDGLEMAEDLIRPQWKRENGRIVVPNQLESKLMCNLVGRLYDNPPHPDNVWREYRTNGNSFFEEMFGGKKIVVLVNKDTVSSAEALVASLMLYNPDIKVVGEPTYGKITVQTYFTFSFEDGGKKWILGLTVGYWDNPLFHQDPRLKDIDANGITPDYVVSGENEQLQKAIELLK